MPADAVRPLESGIICHSRPAPQSGLSCNPRSRHEPTHPPLLDNLGGLVAPQGMAIVRAKLNRAKFHADAFLSGWDQFCHGGTYAFTMKMDVDPPHALHFWWRIRDRTPEEEKKFADLSLIYGDILSNLRGTLDYLIWQLVLAAGNQPTERTSFPCVKRRLIGDLCLAIASEESIPDGLTRSKSYSLIMKRSIPSATSWPFWITTITPTNTAHSRQSL